MKLGMLEAEVKRCAGFKLEQDMLAYILLLCNGDWEQVSETNSCIA